MPDFGLTIKVTDTTNDGPPVPNPTVTLEAQKTGDATGLVTIDEVLVSVTAPGFVAYLKQPYFRPSLQAPVSVSLQRA